MNRQEAAAVLGALQAAWPSFTLSEETILVWAREMGDLDPNDARQALEQILRSDDRFPTISRFRGTTLGVTRRRRSVESQRTGLMPAQQDRPVDRDTAKQKIEEIRAKLRAAQREAS